MVMTLLNGAFECTDHPTSVPPPKTSLLGVAMAEINFDVQSSIDQDITNLHAWVGTIHIEHVEAC